MFPNSMQHKYNPKIEEKNGWVPCVRHLVQDTLGSGQGQPQQTQIEADSIRAICWIFYIGLFETDT